MSLTYNKETNPAYGRKRPRETPKKVRTRLYKIWNGMIGRCYRKTDTSYPRYGAKGITVCDEWRKFAPFEKWSKENGYDDSLTIDRKDGEKGYCPDNCRWATKKEQANNRKNKRRLRK